MSEDFLPIMPFPHSKEELNQLHPAVLSFIGDGVQTLFVRSKLAFKFQVKTGSLHKMTASIVRAVSQAEAVKNIIPLLSEDETGIYKRCRNCKTNSSAKNASVVEYKVASGFEGLIGFLYMSGQHERLLELLDAAYQNKSC